MKNLKFKASRDQLLALLQQLMHCHQVAYNAYANLDADEKLRAAIITELSSRCLQILAVKREHYKLTFKTWEAITLWVEWQGVFPYTTHSGNFINGLLARIHQELLTPKPQSYATAN